MQIKLPKLPRRKPNHTPHLYHDTLLLHQLCIHYFFSIPQQESNLFPYWVWPQQQHYIYRLSLNRCFLSSTGPWHTYINSNSPQFIFQDGNRNWHTKLKLKTRICSVTNRSVYWKVKVKKNVISLLKCLISLIS